MPASRPTLAADQPAPPPSTTLLHVDIDAFYAEVERLANPSLVGQPIIVGGPTNRGVVASASYEARAYGVRSAMPTAQARRLCPHATFITSDFGAYAEASAAVSEVFAAVTPLVEPVSLDEAFLDVGGAQRLFGSPQQIAWRIRSAVQQATSLDCSVGVARTKTLAKLASVAAKPAASREGVRPGLGVKVVPPAEELVFLHAHPVRALWGVGAATARRLGELGVSTVGDLAAVPLAALTDAVGQAHGTHLHQLSNGIDPRPVVVGRAAKSIGHEQTFATDLTDVNEMRPVVVALADGVAGRLRAAGVAARKVQLKVRLADFTTLTRVTTLAAHEPPLSTHAPLARLASQLLQQVDTSSGVRLLGVSAGDLVPLGEASEEAEAPQPEQPELWAQPTDSDRSSHGGDGSEAEAELASTIDDIRARFGRSAIGPGVHRHRGWLQ